MRLLSKVNGQSMTFSGLPKWKKTTAGFITVLMLLFLFYSLVLDHVPATGTPNAGNIVVSNGVSEEAGHDSFAVDAAQNVVLELYSEEIATFHQFRQVLPSDQRRLRSIAFAFADVPKDGYLQVNVHDGDLLIYGGRIDFSRVIAGEYTGLYLNLPPSSNSTRYMTLEVQNTEEDASVYVTGSNLLCRYEYRIASSMGNRMVYILPRILLFILLLAGILYSENILILTDRVFEYRAAVLVFELMAGCFLAPYAYHGRRWLILICMTIIGLAAGLAAPQAYRTVRKQCDTPAKGILFILFSAYTGFAVTGSNTLILPFQTCVTIPKLLVFILAVLWAIPVNMAAFSLLRFYISRSLIIRNTGGRNNANGINADDINVEKRMSKRLFITIVLLLIWIPAVITLCAYNPLISTYDTMTAVHDARNLSTASGDWIPALYTLSIRAGLNILDNVCVIAIEQLLFWSFVITKILLYARRKGIRDELLICFALFIGLNPANVLHVNTGWKDIPYACALLWLVLNLIKITVDGKQYADRTSFHLEFAISLACTYMFRKNGVAPFLAVIVLLLVFFREHRKRYIAIVLSAFFIFLIEGPVCRLFHIGMQPMYKDQRIYTAFAVDSVGMYLAEAEMNEKALNFVAQSTGKHNNNTYRPTYYNFWSLAHFDDRIGAGDFIAFAGDAVLKNPVKYLKVSLARNDILWDIFPGEGRYNTLNCRSEVKEPHWLEIATPRHENILTRLSERFYKAADNSVLYEVLYYRCGLYCWLSLFALLVSALAGRGGKGILIHTPAIAQIFGLWATSGYGGEFRFYWPQNTVCLLLLLTLPVVCVISDQKR